MVEVPGSSPVTPTTVASCRHPVLRHPIRSVIVSLWPTYRTNETAPEEKLHVPGDWLHGLPADACVTLSTFISEAVVIWIRKLCVDDDALTT